jgi:hypothetical protein
MNGGKKMTTNKKEAEWEEAKKKCKLNAETLRMAKEMGLNPRSLIKNIPSKSEQWKAPVSVWIQDMYEERQAKASKKKAVKERKLKDEKI